ncbi:MAG: aminotransferase class I/II-fold pyridoxal phosphate-dependent enzyme, partial [Pseudonocardia sp.]|nr:aminotransferase class I/II-fold pyridoxal phosphate-dependent enzyme [Pseudonocardia sp.]
MDHDHLELDPRWPPPVRPARTPRILVLTVPDNPTGTSAGADLVRRVCELAERHELTIVSDEIYRDLTFAPDRHLSPAAVLPERTVVTGGLSKSMALGGWRIGFARTPDGAAGRTLIKEIVGIASEVWSSLAAPMQAAAAFVVRLVASNRQAALPECSRATTSRSLSSHLPTLPAFGRSHRRGG